MRKRLDYIETRQKEVKALKIEPTESLKEGFSYPLLAKYDFLGNGPRRGSSSDAVAYKQASLLMTRGERLSPILLRIAMALLRLAIGLIIVYFILRGNTFNCLGGGCSFR
jgi:hypothetical protein